MNKLIISLIVVLAFLFSACDDYLSTSPSNDVTESMLFGNVSGAQIVLNGVYAKMKNTIGLGPERKGFAGIQQYASTAGSDIMLQTHGYGGYYCYEYQSVRTEANSAVTKAYWEYYYTIINNVNIILGKIDNIEGDQAKKDNIKGQALAIRGWAYFGLARLYQQTYLIAKNKPCVPIYTERTTPEREQADRASVQQVYDLILADLEASLPLLNNFKRTGLEFINKDVANGILSQVHLTMGNWSKAASYANAARTGYTLMSGSEFRSGFATKNAEWIWGIKQTVSDNIKNENLFAMWNSNGHRLLVNAGGTTEFFPSDEFRSLFDNTDVRNQFRLDARYGKLTSDKFRDLAPDHLGDMIVMRAAEMYLNEAEGMARDNQISGALVLLNELQKKRGVAVVTSTNDKNQLIEAILLERRKELFSEGFDLFDMLRLEKNLVRSGDHINKFTIPAHSYRFILQIPIDEMNMGGISEQNPFDAIYSQ